MDYIITMLNFFNLGIRRFELTIELYSHKGIVSEPAFAKASARQCLPKTFNKRLAADYLVSQDFQQLTLFST